MLNVKVATDKERGRIWDLRRAVPFGREMQNANCPIWSAKAGKLSQNQLKGHSAIKKTEFETVNPNIILHLRSYFIFVVDFICWVILDVDKFYMWRNFGCGEI